MFEHGRFLNTNIAHGSIATHVRCCGILNDKVFLYLVYSWKKVENLLTFQQLTTMGLGVYRLGTWCIMLEVVVEMKLLFLPEKALISRQNALKTIHQSGSIWIRWSCLQHSPTPWTECGSGKEEVGNGDERWDMEKTGRRESGGQWIATYNPPLGS